MALATGGTGPVATARALASQVHPVFMLPAVASSLFGGVLAGDTALVPGAIHVTAVFTGLYVAHVTDGYVDFYVRGEDDAHPLTERGCRVARWCATTAFAACVLALGLVVGIFAALITLPGWFIAAGHAPQLDTNPVTATMGYPTGITLALLGGYYVQATAFAPMPVAFAVVFLIILSGVKVIDDAQDYDYDRSIEKRTIAVVLGRDRAVTLAYRIMSVGLIVTLWLTVGGVFPPFAFLGIVAYGSVAVLAQRANPRVATMLLVRGSYLLLAVLIAAVAFEPFAVLPFPDIGVLGGYTYLATEIAFGSVAFVLLYRAGSLRDYARSLIILYPVAYLWDWYTLKVGVFAIPLRTGWTLFEIPVEEHLFILVVPGFAVGVYETVRQRRDDERSTAARSTAQE